MRIFAKRLTEHCERFAPGGRYYKFMQDGPIRDLIVGPADLGRMVVSASLPIVNKGVGNAILAWIALRLVSLGDVSWTITSRGLANIPVTI